MCEYCEKEMTMLEEDAVNGAMMQWSDNIASSSLWRYEYRNGVFIDARGYLRLVDLDDCNCLDGGQKIKINFCLICGAKITQDC